MRIFDLGLYTIWPGGQNPNCTPNEHPIQSHQNSSKTGRTANPEMGSFFFFDPQPDGRGSKFQGWGSSSLSHSQMGLGGEAQGWVLGGSWEIYFFRWGSRGET